MQNIDTEYLIVGQFLASPLNISTPEQFRRFWASFEPLPPELTNEKSLYRTNADLFYTVEFRGDWHESGIERSIREVSEHSHFFSYVRFVPAVLSDIAPNDFRDRTARFAEFSKQSGTDTPALYPVEFNAVLHERYREHLRDRSRIPAELLRHEFNIIADIQARANR